MNNMLNLFKNLPLIQNPKVFDMHENVGISKDLQAKKTFILIPFFQQWMGVDVKTEKIHAHTLIYYLQNIQFSYLLKTK